jgi:hypothetical protein
VYDMAWLVLFKQFKGHQVVSNLLHDAVEPRLLHLPD